MADVPERKPEPESRDLPLWFRLIVLGILVVLLAANILFDALTDYEGTATSLMLGGIIGTALGFNEFVRGRGGTP
jgi:hypothetical protein